MSVISLAIVFVPGWGLGNKFWKPVQGLLASNLSSALRPKFITSELGDDLLKKIALLSETSFLVAIGHSSGFLWLLQQPVTWNGLIAVNGFTRFTANADFPHGVSVSLLQRMLHRFDCNPRLVLTSFLHSCDNRVRIPELLFSQDSQLRQWLKWLSTEDARTAAANQRTPILALAGKLDQIVPPKMTLSCFTEKNNVTVTWQSDGSHLLPFSHPVWTAEHIRVFLEKITGRGTSPEQQFFLSRQVPSVDQ